MLDRALCTAPIVDGPPALLVSLFCCNNHRDVTYLSDCIQGCNISISTCFFLLLSRPLCGSAPRNSLQLTSTTQSLSLSLNSLDKTPLESSLSIYLSLSPAPRARTHRRCAPPDTARGIPKSRANRALAPPGASGRARG